MNENYYSQSKTSLEEKIDRAAELYSGGVLKMEDAALFLGMPVFEVQNIFYERGILPSKTILVTGGAGFIGSNFVRHILSKYPHYHVINYDKLTYAGNLRNLKDFKDDPRYTFVHADIADHESLEKIIKSGVDYIVNFAAETHVDRSIKGHAREFVLTNVFGVQNILNLLKKYPVEKFLHISTDEVYGALNEESDYIFSEESPLNPQNPYSATKASGDNLCLAYHNTYKLPVVIARPSNNFGPHQYPEKLVPYFVFLAMKNSPLPVYGDGRHMREWLYVLDNCSAIDRILHEGTPGRVYNIGGGNERENLHVVKMVLDILQKPHSLIKFVEDRPGHDRRYALGSERIQRELGWRASHSFEDSLVHTVNWYLDNYDWVLHSLNRGRFFDEHARKR
jgi:dTDP-glucose 4,6-dehydratase